MARRMAKFGKQDGKNVTIEGSGSDADGEPLGRINVVTANIARASTESQNVPAQK